MTNNTFMHPPLQPAAQIVPIDDWQDYLRDGRQFLHTAERAHTRGKKAFTAETLYNLTAMAIEKYIMAFLMRRGDLAENHTMTDLAMALSRHLGPVPHLSEQLHYLDTFQDICDLESAHYIAPNPEQTEKIIAIGKQVEALLLPYLQPQGQP